MDYLQKISKAIKTRFSKPQKKVFDLNEYVYRPPSTLQDFTDSVALLRKIGYENIVTSSIDNVSPDVVEDILSILRTHEIEFVEYQIDISAYEKYLEDAQYLTKYPDYYIGNQPEKTLEHYICLSLLEINETDQFIDIASEHSPIPEIYSRLTGATTFSQDIMYPSGISGNRIGGDACSMPIAESFASKAALTCSLEHFESESDIGLFQELARVLKPGGKVCIVPFYLFNQEATQTDPLVSVPAKVKFDDNSAIYCAEGWGNRHGRFYSPQSFLERIVNPMKGKLDFKLYYLENAADVHKSVYARFAFTATKI
jgi:hypothetical protein